MTSNFQFLKNVKHLLPVALIASTLALHLPRAALAQGAEVPRPNRNGDFMTAFVLGNRGYYTNEKWLVVVNNDGRDYYLNCRRTPNGEILSRIRFGAIIEAVFLGSPNTLGSTEPNLANDAIVLENGAPWLRVRGTSGWFDPDLAGDGGSLVECYVRANWQYIAPVNNEWSRAPHPR